MDNVSFGIILVEHTGEERGPVEAGIERAQMVDILVLHLDASKHIVPALATLLLDGIERLVAHLLQVALGLFGGDERRSHTNHHLLVLLRHEAGHCENMIAFGLVSCKLVAVLLDSPEFKALVDFHDEIVAEVLWHTAAVASGITRNGATVHIILDGRALVEGIDDDAGDAFFAHAGLRERKPQYGSTLRGSNFSPDVVLSQVHLIIIRARDLGVVRKPRGTLLLVVDQVGRWTRHPVDLGHDGELAVVIDPRRRLVGLLEAPYLVCRVGILPTVAHFTGLRHPEVHAPRHGDGRIGVAR